MASAQLRSPLSGQRTPRDGISDSGDSSTAEAGGSDKVGQPEGSPAQDSVSIVDGTEDDTRRLWSHNSPGEVNTRGRSLNRNTTRKRKRRSKSRSRSSSSSSSSSTSSSSESSSSSSSSSSSDSEDEENKFKPVDDVQHHIPKSIIKFVSKYASKGVNKKIRHTVSRNLPIPKSKKLRGLNLDRFFKKNFMKGKKWNGKLEKGKINTQMRILDPLGPLSILWAEAERIKKLGKGMNPSDVIELVRRAIVLVGNAHFLYNNDRRKAILASSMPEAIDLLSNRKIIKALSKSHGNLFGQRFLKQVAKDNKNNKELRELLSFDNNNSRKRSYEGRKPYRRQTQFFQGGPSSSLRFGGPHRGQTGQYRRPPQRYQYQSYRQGTDSQRQVGKKPQSQQ